MKKGDITLFGYRYGTQSLAHARIAEIRICVQIRHRPRVFPFLAGDRSRWVSLFRFIICFKEKYSAEDLKPRLPGLRSLGRLGLIMLIMAGFALVMNILGFILTVFLFVSVILFALEGDSILKSVFYGVMFSAALTSLDLNAFQYRKDIDEALALKIPEIPVRQFLMKNLARNESGGFHWKMNLEVIEKNYATINEELPRDRQFHGPTLFIRGENSEYIQMDDLPVHRSSFFQKQSLSPSKTQAIGFTWMHRKNFPRQFSISCLSNCYSVASQHNFLPYLSVI